VPGAPHVGPYAGTVRVVVLSRRTVRTMGVTAMGP